MTPRRALAVWIVGSTIGAVLIALPDAGPRVFEISDRHGPGWLDLAGIVVLVAAWAPVWAGLARGRERLGALPLRIRLGALLIAAGAVLALVVVIGADVAGAWWLLPALVLAALQLAAFRVAARRPGAQ